jgi:hypothetical protein
MVGEPVRGEDQRETRLHSLVEQVEGDRPEEEHAYDPGHEA